jgi:hypothetical protein
VDLMVILLSYKLDSDHTLMISKSYNQ